MKATEKFAEEVEKWAVKGERLQHHKAELMAKVTGRIDAHKQLKKHSTTVSPVQVPLPVPVPV